MKKSIYRRLLGMFIGSLFFGVFVSSVYTHFKLENRIFAEVQSQLETSILTMQSFINENDIPFENLETLKGSDALIFKFSKAVDEYGLSESELKAADMGVIFLSEGDKAYTDDAPVAITKNGSYYIIGIYENKTLSGAMRYMIAINNFTILFIGIVSVTFLARLFTKPILALTKVTNQVAEGNFDVVLPQNRDDEIGELISSFGTMLKRLQSTELLRTNFITDISHEFKTPLTSIKGYAHLLQDATPEMRRHYISIITAEVERLSQMTSNILLLNKLDQQESNADFTLFSLDEQIRKAILLVENRWKKKQMAYEISLDKATCFGNEALLFQLWINLIDNAIKFSEEGSQLRISMEKKDAYLRIIIEDHGQGIPPEELENVFTKFYKGDRSRHSDGNGLGLSIVKQIIELHKGSIEVSSTPGEGSTFIVTLPQAEIGPG